MIMMMLSIQKAGFYNMYNSIDAKSNDIKSNYHLLISGIVPRPIAFVGSKKCKGDENLAPFSFFNGFGANPPIVGFSPALSGRTGKPKDTLLNIKEYPEFSISIVNYDIVEQMSLSSSEYSRGIDEFTKSGLEKFKCDNINVSAVKGSPFIMECKLYDIIDLGGKPASGNLILGEVVKFHVREDIYTNGRIDPLKIDAVSRLGYSWYSRSNEGLFEIKKPRVNGIGFDALPDYILNSEFFSGNELAKLAGVESVPSFSEEKFSNNKEEIISNCKYLLSKDEIDKAWQLVIQLGKLIEK